jgi:hypothetical protein
MPGCEAGMTPAITLRWLSLPDCATESLSQQLAAEECVQLRKFSVVPGVSVKVRARDDLESLSLLLERDLELPFKSG